MVRLRRLRLFRGRDRASVLSGSGPDGAAARHVRRLRARLSDAADWRRHRRSSRRPVWTAYGVDRVDRGDGNPDLSDRAPPRLPNIGIAAPLLFTLLRMLQGL